MRVIFALLLVGGCVDGNPTVDPTDPMLDMNGELDPMGPSTPRVLTPETCDARAWQITPDTKNSQLHIVPTPAGASIFTVPLDGGAVRGFRVDNRADLLDRDLATIREDRLYTSVAANLVADRLVVASVSDDKVALDIVRDDLGERHELGDVSGSFAAPIVQSRETQIALVAGAEGVTANSFSGALWQPAGTQEITKSAIVSATALSYHDDALVVYSTPDHECHLEHFATGRKSIMRDGCDNAQIAVDTGTGNGFMVYEQGGSILQTRLRINATETSELLETTTLDVQSTQPRLVYDGKFFWMSYLDARGELVIGVYDGKRVLTRRALEGFTPGPAYDLQVFAGGVWIVGVELDGFLAQRFCATLK